MSLAALKHILSPRSLVPSSDSSDQSDLSDSSGQSAVGAVEPISERVGVGVKPLFRELLSPDKRGSWRCWTVVKTS